MKITCSKKDEILKRKAEYDAKLAEYKQAEEESWDKFMTAQDNVTSPIAHQIEGMLARFPALHFDVDVRIYSRRRIEVRIDCNERQVSSKDSALSWDWRATIDDDGEVVKSSNSWSGLNACTPAHLEQLRQTVDALVLLNGIDWAVVLNVNVPSWKDFKVLATPPEKLEDFDRELVEAELEEILGQNKVIKCYNWEASGYRGQYVWLQLVSETPSMYNAKVQGNWYDPGSDNFKRQFNNYDYTQRVRKTTVRPVEPYEIVEV